MDVLKQFINYFRAICGGFRGGSFEYAYARVNRAIRRDLLTSLVHQEVAFYDAHKTGESKLVTFVRIPHLQAKSHLDSHLTVRQCRIQ